MAGVGLWRYGYHVAACRCRWHLEARRSLGQFVLEDQGPSRRPGNMEHGGTVAGDQQLWSGLVRLAAAG
jgi:hypothetical protein